MLSLRSRLTLGYTVLFGVLLVGLAVVSYRVLAYQLDQDVDDNLDELTQGLHGYVRFGDDAPSIAFDENDAAEAAFVEQATRYYQLFDVSSGRLLAQSEALRPLGLEFTADEVRQLAADPRTLDLQTDYGRLRLSNSLLTAGSHGRYLLQVGVSLAPLDATLRRYLVLLLIGVPAGLALAIAVGRSLARLALAPLSRLAEASRTVTHVRDLHRRVPVRGARDELDDVAAAFNETLSRLEHAVAEMRQFSTALAHELRTPLTALRGEIELALGDDAADAALRSRFERQLDAIDRLKRLIDQILTLARAEAGEIPLVPATIDLSDIARTLAEDMDAVAAARGVGVTVDGAQPVVIRGDAEWIRRLVLNLLDNAIKFTPRGGQVTVRTATDGPQGVLQVCDTGVGISETGRAHVFEPFYRDDPARPANIEGAGLGLALVQWIADQHAADLEVDSAAGRGTTVTVRLPSAGPSATH